MSPALDQVLQVALTLPETERQHLVDALLETLPEEAIEPDEGLVEELDRRCAEIDSGQAHAIPFDDVIEPVRKK